MEDFVPPSGPPPPRAPSVPAGWVARWNEQYKEWFFVNIYTKKSQWEMPTAPAQPLEDALPDEPPPGYEPGPRPAPTDSKKPLQDMSAPAATGGPSSSLDEDARLAARLQAEEDAMARTSSRQEEQFPQQLPPRDRDKSKSGFLGKLFNKAKSPAPASPGAHGDYRPQQQAGYYQPQSPQPPQQQQQYGAYAGQASYPPNAGYNAGYGGAYGGQYRGPYGGGYGGPPGQAYHQQQQQQQQPQRRTGGMGAMGPGLAGAALGVGAGVLGGAMISNAINDHQQDAYMEGYADGMDNDYGGDDFGGGDFGGDF